MLRLDRWSENDLRAEIWMSMVVMVVLVIVHVAIVIHISKRKVRVRLSSKDEWWTVKTDHWVIRITSRETRLNYWEWFKPHCPSPLLSHTPLSAQDPPDPPVGWIKDSLAFGVLHFQPLLPPIYTSVRNGLTKDFFQLVNLFMGTI